MLLLCAGYDMPVFRVNFAQAYKRSESSVTQLQPQQLHCIEQQVHFALTHILYNLEQVIRPHDICGSLYLFIWQLCTKHDIINRLSHGPCR